MIDAFTPLNFGLGETNDMLREHVAGFASDTIAPLAADIDRDNQFPNQLWLKFGEMGLLGVTVDEQYGGANMGYVATLLPWKKLAAHPLLLG